MKSLHIAPKALLAVGLFILLVTTAFSQPQATATLLSVVDGDTLRVEFQGKEERVVDLRD